VPFEYFRDDVKRRVRFVVTSPISEQDMIGMIDRRVADGVWGYGVLVDTREALQPPSDTTSLVNRVTEVAERLGPSGPVAVVATTAPFVSTSTALEHKTGRAMPTMETFWDYSEADRWLDAMMARPTL
jgi:hypothetical protein